MQNLSRSALILIIDFVSYQVRVETILNTTLSRIINFIIRLYSKDVR